MTDDLENRLEHMLADRGRPDPVSVEALLNGIDALPPRRARPLAPAAAAVLAVALIGLVGIVALHPPLYLGGPPLPPNPAAFAGDPRLDACFGDAGEVEAAFEMRAARDYQRHLPGMLRSPELEVDDPAFVVVFAGDVSLPRVQPASGEGQIVCVLVGDTPNVYVGVDTSGLLAVVPMRSAAPTATVPSPVPTATPVAGPTVAPAPAWAADLTGQLECGMINASIGNEVVVAAEPMDPVATPEGALGILLGAGRAYAWLPATGFEPAIIEGDWALHRYTVDGRLKVIAISTKRFEQSRDDIGWEIVGLRACNPAEFDPADGLSDGSTIWLDDAGDRVPTAMIFSRPGPGHCGWESATFLHLEGSLYLRDPEDVLAGRTVMSFATVDAMPADAVDTGLHTSEWRLFTVRDTRVVYVKAGDGVIERWARAIDQFACL